MSGKTLTLLHQRLKPLGTTSMPLNVEPSRETRFGTPLALSRVHWVRPELVAEISFLTWTEDGLLRQAVFIGLREDKPAGEVLGASCRRPEAARASSRRYEGRLAPGRSGEKRQEAQCACRCELLDRILAGEDRRARSLPSF